MFLARIGYSYSVKAEPEKVSNSSTASVRRISGKLLVGVSIVVVLTLGLLAYGRTIGAYQLAMASLQDLTKQLGDLSAQVQQLKQEQALPALVLNRYRNSIGYVYGVYHVGFSGRRPEIRVRVSGTGFLVGGGLVVTNRHVAEPWYGDEDAKRLIDRGAAATLESLAIFFPNLPKPSRLLPGAISKTSDLAVLRTEDPDLLGGLAVLPLADSPGPAGQLVTVIGYPLGITGMLAKSPAGVYERLSSRQGDINTVNNLAAKSLIRPSATYGHLGDIVGDKLIYDAPSAHGGSGGPVLNTKGEVIGINFAYMDGFSGATLGVSVDSLRPLLEEVKALRPNVTNRNHPLGHTE